MSQILLYITLFIASPANIGNAYELSSKSYVYNAALASVETAGYLSQTLIEPDSDQDSLINELLVLAHARFYSIQLASCYNLLSYAKLNVNSIRAPPVIT